MAVTTPQLIAAEMERRAALGAYTGAMAAAEIGCPEPTFNRWSNGRIIRVGVAYRPLLAAWLGISVDELVAAIAATEARAASLDELEERMRLLEIEEAAAAEAAAKLPERRGGVDRRRARRDD